jgi:hypothetical protein
VTFVDDVNVTLELGLFELLILDVPVFDDVLVFEGVELAVIVFDNIDVSEPYGDIVCV